MIFKLATLGMMMVQTGIAVEEPSDIQPQDQPVEYGVAENQPLGWLRVVPSQTAEELGRPLSELEFLSISPSGIRFGTGLYDPKADNPLIPISVTLRALDKITAAYTDLEIKIGEETRFGDLSIVPKSCDKRPPEEVPETTAFLVIDDLRAAEAEEPSTELPTEEASSPIGETVNLDIADAPITPMGDASLEVDAEIAPAVSTVERDDSHLFSGWMFASSPALNPLEHAVYDVWVIDCKMVDPSTE